MNIALPAAIILLFLIILFTYPNRFSEWFWAKVFRK
jgi:hypothetical protein